MNKKMGSGVRNLTAQEMRELAVSADVNIPVEQTWVWYEFENSFPDRDMIGFFSVIEGGKPVALISLMKLKYHGFDIVWAKRGPVWLVEPTPKSEHRLVDTLVSWIRERAPMTAFIRMHLRFPRDDYNKPAQIVTYDRTVHVDLKGDPSDVFTRFKKRTRGDIRRYRRRSPVQVANETAKAIEDFSDYYRLLSVTAKRQGFTPWGQNVYANLLNTLEQEHARIYSARFYGKLVAWALFTMSGIEVAYYYAASTEVGREVGAPAQLLAFAAQDFAKEQFEYIDLMGIGSPRMPALKSLTSFKSGFANEHVDVAPAFDIPVNKVLYGFLASLREGKTKTLNLLTNTMRAYQSEVSSSKGGHY